MRIINLFPLHFSAPDDPYIPTRNPKAHTLTPKKYGNVLTTTNETEVQEWDDDGNLIESVDQTTTVDEYGDVEVETDVVQEDGEGGYDEYQEDDTYVHEGDGDDEGY